MTAEEFERLVKKALIKLNLHNEVHLSFDHLWAFGTAGINETFMVIFRDSEISNWYQTDPVICDEFNQWNDKIQERSAELAVHFRGHILNLDRGKYTINVETKLPYWSLTQQKVVAAGGSHYNEFTLNDDPVWNKLRDEDKLVVRIAWGILKAYKYWNDEINAMIKDISR